MTNNSSKNHILGLLPLLLFALLSACVLTVLLTGAEIYGNIGERGNTSYVNRTAAQYISVKVKQASESENTIDVEDFGGETALALRESIDGEQYVTRIYCYDGYLRELFSHELIEMAPEDGEKLLEMSELSAINENGLLTITLTDNDKKNHSIILDLRAIKEGAS